MIFINIISVEGPSDEWTLGINLSRYFENYEVYVEIMHMDITKKWGKSDNNHKQNL